MKSKRTKPRPTAPKGKRWPPSSKEEWTKYLDALEHGESLDMEHDRAVAKYKKSEKYQQAQQLADKFKKRAK